MDDGAPSDETDATVDEADDVDAEIVEGPGTEVDEESAAGIRSQIENADTEPEPEPEVEPSVDIEPGPSAGVWHEPTTDELRITHPDHDIDQPDLFDSEQPPGNTPNSTGSRV